MRRARELPVVIATVTLLSTGLFASPARAESKVPDRWDPRVAKYVRFVEQHRKLEFEHPVKVRFFDDAAFVKAYQGDDPKITEKDRAEAERIAGQLRALGLIQGPVDLIQSQRDLGATDTVGFYDQQRKALYVRGTDLKDLDVRVTLVHELTHALQDQHFDLTELDDRVETSGEDFALTALVEGDATSVEDDYLFSLPRAEQDAFFAEDPQDSTNANPDAPSTADVPPVLELFTGGPYIYGPRYIEFLRAAGGRSRIDRAFSSPPITEEEIVDPVAAIAARKPLEVPTPKLTAGERRRGRPDDFGALSLYLVLASRIDPQVALRAAEGWGGDRYVGFTERGGDGRECVRVAFVGDTRADTREMADALGAWAASLPAGTASATTRHGRVVVDACDSGTADAPSEATLDGAVTLLVDRNDLVRELLRGQVPPTISRCAADTLAVDPTVLGLLDAERFTKEQEAQLTTLVTDAVGACARR